MAVFEAVYKLAKEWQPQALPTELQYRNSLTKCCANAAVIRMPTLPSVGAGKYRKVRQLSGQKRHHSPRQCHAISIERLLIV